MHDTLGMHDSLDLFKGCAVESVCLYDLVTLIEKGRTVHGDLCAHAPSGMFQRICRADRQQFLFRLMQKRTAARRQNEPFKGSFAAEIEALKDRGMFAVHGHKLSTRLFYSAQDEFPPADE